jgi:thiosulfate/3-mercaptopyruvate sulfurtransferase
MHNSFFDGPVVDAGWLAEHLDEVTVADVRWYLGGRSGYQAFLQRHIPGAVFVDLDRCLAIPASAAEGRHPLPSPATFATSMASLGISNTTKVVAYDDDAGRVAARLVWLLRVSGHEAALLDGGIKAWPGPFASGPAPTPAAGMLPVGTFLLDRWPGERFARAEDVVSAGLVLDARAPERFRGEVEPVDPRAGHIPGAKNAPTAANIDDEGRFKAPGALRAMYEDLGVGPGIAPVVYCGSGVTACHDLLALELAGFDQGRLYAGSWSQWSADPSRAAATGA